MVRRLMSTASLLLAVAAAGTSPAAAEETNNLWPRFAIDAGAYQISTSDKIQVQGVLELANADLELEQEIGLPDNDTLLSLKLDWAFAERHSIAFSYWSLDRSSSRSIRRDIEIGGVVFPIGAEARVEFDTTTLGAAYTYWFMRHENFGLGGTIGLVYLGLDAQASDSVEVGLQVSLS